MLQVFNLKGKREGGRILHYMFFLLFCRLLIDSPTITNHFMIIDSRRK